MSLAMLKLCMGSSDAPHALFFFRYISQWGDSEVDITCKRTHTVIICGKHTDGVETVRTRSLDEVLAVTLILTCHARIVQLLHLLYDHVKEWINTTDRYINIKAPERSGLEFKESQIHKVGHLLNTVRLLHHPVVILENGSHYHHTS